MHRLGIEPRSTGWKPVILPLNYRCSRGIYIICVLNISTSEKGFGFGYKSSLHSNKLNTNLRFESSTPEKGFEPLTSSLGGKRSIQAELPGHKLSRINRFKNDAGEKQIPLELAFVRPSVAERRNRPTVRINLCGRKDSNLRKH